VIEPFERDRAEESGGDERGSGIVVFPDTETVAFPPAALRRVVEPAGEFLDAPVGEFAFAAGVLIREAAVNRLVADEAVDPAVGDVDFARVFAGLEERGDVGAERRFPEDAGVAAVDMNAGDAGDAAQVEKGALMRRRGDGSDCDAGNADIPVRDVAGIAGRRAGGRECPRSCCDTPQPNDTFGAWRSAGAST
jgi:hypothetical protein